MDVMQAMDLISKNLGRLSGSREDHQILLQAEMIVRKELASIAMADLKKEAVTEPQGQTPATT